MFLSLISSLYAYDAIFEQDTISGVREVEMQRQTNELLQKSCMLQKKRRGFLWPCYLVRGSRMTSLEIAHDCRIKMDKVKSMQSLPSEKQTARLPKLCRELIHQKRRVLAYKAKGI